jgi:hypothetical protein
VLAAGQLGIGLGKPVHRRGVPHDGQGLLERLQILWSDKDGRRPTVNGHGHPLVLVVHPADELRQVRLDVAQRKNSHSQKYDQKN